MCVQVCASADMWRSKIHPQRILLCPSALWVLRTEVRPSGCGTLTLHPVIKLLCRKCWPKTHRYPCASTSQVQRLKA